MYIELSETKKDKLPGLHIVVWWSGDDVTLSQQTSDGSAVAKVHTHMRADTFQIPALIETKTTSECVFCVFTVSSADRNWHGVTFQTTTTGKSASKIWPSAGPSCHGLCYCQVKWPVASFFACSTFCLPFLPFIEQFICLWTQTSQGLLQRTDPAQVQSTAFNSDVKVQWRWGTVQTFLNLSVIKYFKTDSWSYTNAPHVQMLLVILQTCQQPSSLVSFGFRSGNAASVRTEPVIRCTTRHQRHSQTLVKLSRATWINAHTHDCNFWGSQNTRGF